MAGRILIGKADTGPGRNHGHQRCELCLTLDDFVMILQPGRPFKLRNVDFDHCVIKEHTAARLRNLQRSPPPLRSMTTAKAVPVNTTSGSTPSRFLHPYRALNSRDTFTSHGYGLMP